MNQHEGSDWTILRTEDEYNYCKIIKGHEVGGKGIDLEEIIRGVKGEHYQDAFINFSKIKKYAK